MFLNRKPPAVQSCCRSASAFLLAKTLNCCHSSRPTFCTCGCLPYPLPVLGVGQPCVLIIRTTDLFGCVDKHVPGNRKRTNRSETCGSTRGEHLGHLSASTSDAMRYGPRWLVSVRVNALLLFFVLMDTCLLRAVGLCGVIRPVGARSCAATHRACTAVGSRAVQSWDNSR